MELAQRSRCKEQLHDAKHPAHDGGDVDKVLVGKELWVRHGEGLNGLFAGSFDVGVHAEEADGLVVVDLEHLVNILGVLGKRLLDIVEAKFLNAKFHEGSAPADEPTRT